MAQSVCRTLSQYILQNNSDLTICWDRLLLQPSPAQNVAAADALEVKESDLLAGAHGAAAAAAAAAAGLEPAAGMHGKEKGLFATVPLAAGCVIGEYRGEVLSAHEVTARYPDDPPTAATFCREHFDG